ncbi:EAL domain-containing response regulator [Arcobacter sp. CECT 8985]|uniref:EAL domain-containing response regulator n=1 Tax=Arcobacter sp. CECT 8985 TaxID=1935424 RepID=UPI00100A4F21|nr:EAL domain-containing response regulator [Arcobacter sp. CECT 8985]RXJ84270.1 histidine kinase [Arcobacter sp. CECT 8985]
MSINILSVENMGITKKLSTEKNYNITHHTNIKEVLKHIKKFSFEFIILDLTFIKLKKEKFLQKIDDYTNNDTRVIIIDSENNVTKQNFTSKYKVIEHIYKNTITRQLLKNIKLIINSINSNHNNKILVVDDSKFIRNSMNEILTAKNYNVLLAGDVYDALNIIKTNKIDLIFTDLEMPKVSGITFIEVLKRNEFTKDIPILVISGSGNKEYFSKALKAGAIDYIRKPFIDEEISLKADLHIKHFNQMKRIASKSKELSEYKKILNESEIVTKTNNKGIITYANNNFMNISGFSKAELLDKPHNMLRHFDIPKEVFEELWQCIKDKKTYKGIIKNKKKNGESYYVDATISPILDLNGNIKELISIKHDISDIMNSKKLLLDELKYMKSPILVFLKIMNYELLKDFYSEVTMYEFKNEFTKKVFDYFPKDSELKKVYNLGDGNFALLNDTDADIKTINETLQKVVYNFSNKGLAFKDIVYDIKICMSFSNKKENIYDDVSLGIEHAIKTNKSIVYAKNFYIKRQIEATTKLKTLKLVKDALEGKDSYFESFFQGIVDNETQEITKYESLVRLNKKNEIISPFYFLDLSKKTGYYINITKEIIRNSFRTLKAKNVDISINISETDIQNSEIKNLLLNLVSKEEFKGRVTFELLEDESIKNMNSVKNFIWLAKKLGNVQIAIDDFGSGYSNFERLLEFQPDFLKIDGSLIKNITTNPFSQNLVESIVLFAKKQQIKVIAEFVENEDIYNKVKELGIDYSQGYHFHKPCRL